MRCSLYRHQLKLGTQKHDRLAEAILPFNNYYARIFGITSENWQQRLDQYFFVGDADRLQESFDLFASMIDRDRVLLPTTNTTTAIQETSFDSLTSKQIKAFKEENALDYALYEYAVNTVNHPA